jgi:hypothetical protein
MSNESMKSACLLLVMFGAALTGCGREPGRAEVPSPPAAPSPPAGPALIHSPPIAQLPAAQLRSLSMECEKYVPDKSARGPYDAAYCEEAIAAWSDSPLQIVPIEKDEPIPNPAGSPQPDTPKPDSPKPGSH